MNFHFSLLTPLSSLHRLTVGIIRADAIKCVKEGLKIPLIIHLTHSIVLALCLSIKQIKQIFILGIISQKKPFCLWLNNTARLFNPFLNLIKARLSVSCESNLYDSFLLGFDPPQDVLNKLYGQTRILLQNLEHRMNKISFYQAQMTGGWELEDQV